MVTIEPIKYAVEVHDWMHVILVETKDWSNGSTAIYKDAFRG
jgi:hypothetical protein